MVDVSLAARVRRPIYASPVAADELRSIYLLTGSDRPKVRRALARLRSRFPDEAQEHLSAERHTGADAVAAMNALGLFGADSGRLVIVHDVEFWKVADVESLSSYLADPLHRAVLALVAWKPPKSKKLQDLCEKHGQVLAYDAPRPRDLPSWVRSQFERLGKDVDSETARALVEIVGDKVEVLEREIEKLVTWAGADPIERSAVLAIAVPALDAPPWDLTDSWAAQDSAAVLRAADRARGLGKEAFVIAAGLASHVRFVNEAEALREDGLSTKEIAKHVKRHEFRVRKALSETESRPRTDRDLALVTLAELDAALKGAGRLSSDLELERALVAAAQPAG